MDLQRLPGNSRTLPKPRQDVSGHCGRTVEVAFTTSTDLASRTVTLTNPKLVKTQFPTLDTGEAVNVEDRIKAALDNLGEKRVPLDTLLISLRQDVDKPAEVPLKNEPPAIFTSQRAAGLLVFDGEPIMTPVAGTPLSYVCSRRRMRAARPGRRIPHPGIRIGSPTRFGSTGRPKETSRVRPSGPMRRHRQPEPRARAISPEKRNAARCCVEADRAAKVGANWRATAVHARWAW